MTNHTVHSMASSVGETFDNYNGDTWKDKDSMIGSDDGMSFEQDSLNDISLNRTPRDVTPLATINENSSAKGTGSSHKTRGDDLGWLQGKDNSVGSFMSPYLSSRQQSPQPRQSAVKESPQTSGNGHHHHHGHHRHTDKPSTASASVAGAGTSADKDAIKSKREFSAHVFLSVVTLLLALSLVMHLSRHHDVVKVIEKRVPIVSNSPFSGWFGSSEQQVQHAIEENPSGWMDSITAGVLAKKSIETEKAKKEAAEKQKEIDRLERSRKEARDKAAARELESKREREEALAKAAKEEAERKEAQKARLRAEQELAELEAKHAEEEKRHKKEEEKRAKERKEEIARLERERIEEIERLKKEEEERVLVEAARKAKAIYKAEMEKKKELEAAKEAEKLAIAKAQAAKEAERKAHRRRSTERSASAFSWIATILVMLGVVASVFALALSPFYSRTLKGLVVKATAFLNDLLARAPTPGAANSVQKKGAAEAAPADSGAEETEKDDGADDVDGGDKQWKEVATPAPKKGGARGRSKTPARKAKTPAAKSTAKRTPARSRSKGRKAPATNDGANDDDEGEGEGEASQGRRGRTPLRRSGRVNNLESGTYIVD